MNKFKIVEVLNGNTIRVTPHWKIKDESTGREFSGETLNINGFNATKDDDYAKVRLQSFLTGKEVELSAPHLTERNLPTDPEISCTVKLQETNIIYYFPEYSQVLV